MTEMHTQDHLGGYIEGGDPATYYPDLWRWFVEKQHVEMVLDVGCGEGHALSFFRSLGCGGMGIDGVPQDDTLIFTHDYTTGPLSAQVTKGADGLFDLVWSCEFVEHVEERFMPDFLDTFKLGRMVAMTHADPGQIGWHHVNCQPGAYWIGALAAVGFQLDAALTQQARTLAARNTNPLNHFVRSGLVFQQTGETA